MHLLGVQLGFSCLPVSEHRGHHLNQGRIGKTNRSHLSSLFQHKFPPLFLQCCCTCAGGAVRLAVRRQTKEMRSNGNKAQAVFPLESVFILVIASTSGTALKSFQTICFITYFCFQCINFFFFFSLRNKGIALSRYLRSF